MKIVIFGLTISSSWGNGHATLWRALCRALGRRGHQVVFFERDVPYYAAHRDIEHFEGGRLLLYSTWDEAWPHARRELADADVGLVTSYCPDARAAATLLGDSPALRVFYDLDSPVTLELVRHGEPVSYLGENGLADYDLVLSYTGGRALEELRSRLGARQVAPLYGSVDPEVHYAAAPDPQLRCDLSYLGTYASDRQDALERLFVEPARQLPRARFVIGGALYPPHFPWTRNIFFLRHVEPSRHAAFFASSRLTLNVTRRAMKAMGFCPSGRLFEAAACGAALISDSWDGLDRFFTPGREILVASEADDVVAALGWSDEELRRLARAGRERALDEHTADHRAAELEHLLSAAAAPTPAGQWRGES
ncbi:MAG: glycosyltransferase [Opitutaceae bacterium]